MRKSEVYCLKNGNETSESLTYVTLYLVLEKDIRNLERRSIFRYIALGKICIWVCVPSISVTN